MEASNPVNNASQAHNTKAAPAAKIDLNEQALEEARARAGFFRNLPIGAKLALSLGSLLILIFLVVAGSLLGTYLANQKI